MTDDELFLAIHLASRSTGLPMNVWIRSDLSPRLLAQTEHRQPFDPDHVAMLGLNGMVIAGRLDAADLALGGSGSR